MISISKLYCGKAEPFDELRYGPPAKPGAAAARRDSRKPVVVWNVTQRCNLNCVHCYARSGHDVRQDDLTTVEGLRLLEDLAQFTVPVVLFSGGEPLMRGDIFELAARAHGLGLRAVLSTNGTLIDTETAARLKGCGVTYVGISLDGMQRTNDVFRGVKGAYDMALTGVRNSRDAGVKVGLRFTITKNNAADVPAIFDLVREEGISRVCFYHLVYAGRGSSMMSEDLDHAAARRLLDLIIDKTAELHKEGLGTEVLTVDNLADGPYLYLRMKREGHPGAGRALDLLRANGGAASGAGIGCVSWDGSVHPDQFWRHESLGNVRQRPFHEIWTDPSQPLLGRLRNARDHVMGRCAACRFLDCCGGNFRVRAEAATGDLWAGDPACYLTDDETGTSPRSGAGIRGEAKSA